MRVITLLLLSYFLVACSSNLSKGNNMMDAEQFDEAVRYYEKAIQDDPGDTEVATKLYEARTRMVMANLIKVRLQRQSNQHRAAALVLNKSLHNIKHWKIIADSGVKATIEDEVYEGGIWLNNELSSIAKREDHNTFFYTLKQFNYILDAGGADNTISVHKPKLLKQGQAQCRDMKQDLTKQSYYLHDVWITYCGVFAVKGNYILAKDSSRYKYPKVSYNRLKISKEAGISGKQVAYHIERNIKNHPWFSSHASSVMALAMSGRINYAISSQPKTFTRKFMAYDETLELVKDPKNPKKIIRKLVHRKKVPKSVSFLGKEYTEVSSHDVSVKGGLAQGHKVQANHQSSKQKELIPAHNTYFKEQGISPLRAKFKNQQNWKNSISNGLVKEIKQDLDKAWVDQFCSDQNIDTRLSKNEYAVRCSVYKPDHGLVNAWTQSEFSLSLTQLNIMLGKTN
jgi:tetratricopeptide (TPR) repeat protein